MNRNEIENKISQTYNNLLFEGISAKELLAEHQKIIDSIDGWTSVEDYLPQDGQECICIEDLTRRGRGKFIGFFYFSKAENGFVANIGDCDPYGHVTHWIAVQ